MSRRQVVRGVFMSRQAHRFLALLIRRAYILSITPGTFEQTTAVLVERFGYHPVLNRVEAFIRLLSVLSTMSILPLIIFTK